MSLSSFGLGIVIGLMISAGVVMYKASQTLKAVPGAVTPEIQRQVATPEVRTVRIYRNAQKPKGATGDVLTAVQTDTGTATTMLDAAGVATIVLRTNPLPWIAKESAHQATLIYGSAEGEAVKRLGYRWEFLQVKRLHFGLAAETELGEGRTLVGVGLTYRW